MASILQSTKISAAVSGSLTGQTSGTFTLYTCPANSYAILNLRVVGTSITANLVKVAGVTVQAGSTPSSGGSPVTIYVGPSQAVTLVLSAATSGDIASVTGVEFINTT